MNTIISKRAGVSLIPRTLLNDLRKIMQYAHTAALALKAEYPQPTRA